MQNLTFQYDPNRLPEAVTSGQKKLSEAIDHNRVVFVTGPAGTGKTYI